MPSAKFKPLPVIFIVVVLLLGTHWGSAQNLLQNGSMTSPVGEDVVAPGWMRTPGGQFTNSPDINDVGPLNTTPGYSWYPSNPVSSADGGTWQNVFSTEGLQQTITGLTVGQTYFFSFEYCTQGIWNSPSFSYTTAFVPQLSITGATGYVDPVQAGTLFVWQRHSVLVTATSGSVTIFLKSGNDAYIAFDGPYFSTSPPLPVLLMDFDLVVNNRQADLHWTTSAELNSHHFEIESSADAVHWQYAGTLQAAGYSSNIKEYQYTDFNLTQNRYYRLKLFDNDGSFTVSKVLLAKISARDMGIVLYPNPANTAFSIAVNGVDELLGVCLFNSTGALCKIIPVQPGARLISVDIRNIAAGVYFIKATAKSGTVISKVLMVK